MFEEYSGENKSLGYYGMDKDYEDEVDVDDEDDEDEDDEEEEEEEDEELYNLN